MKNENFLFILILSLFASTIIFYFNTDLWGWFLINMMALEYFNFLNKKYLCFTIIILIVVLIFFSSLVKKIFFISISSLFIQIFCIIMGWKNGKNNIW